VNVKRSAQTKGQLSELSQLMLRILSRVNLTHGESQMLAEGERPLTELMNLILRVDPRRVDLPQLKEVLQLERKFKPLAKNALVEMNYKIVSVPPGMTLVSMWDFDTMGSRVYPELSRFDSFPTIPREIAWRPDQPLAAYSTTDVLRHETGSAELAVGNPALTSLEGEVRAIIPTAEEALWLRLTYGSEITRQSSTPAFTRTVNWCGNIHLQVGDFRAGGGIKVISETRVSLSSSVLRVLEILVPK